MSRIVDPTGSRTNFQDMIMDYEEYLDFLEDLRDQEENGPIDGVGFADPGGRSALRAATPENPRNQPCPTCKKPNRLTPIDVARHYVCDECADQTDQGW